MTALVRRWRGRRHTEQRSHRRRTRPHGAPYDDSPQRLPWNHPAAGGFVMQTERGMEDAGVGFVAALFIGAIAGWLAERVTGSSMGLITNIILGVIGAGIASWLFGLLGLRVGPGWLGYLVSGFVGACLLILATRIFYPTRWRA
jgi:uncharacterized membrane protein YeaQ/YmgE (transglycosylase-associated protein family)